MKIPDELDLGFEDSVIEILEDKNTKIYYAIKIDLRIKLKFHKKIIKRLSNTGAKENLLY